MKKTMLTLAFLPALALAAAAQDLAPGDRIEITFRSDATIVGTIVASPRTAPAASVTLDLAPEYPGLSGTLTVPKSDIKSVRKLRIPITPWQCDMGPKSPKAPPVSAPPPKPAVVEPEPPKPEVVSDDKAAKAAAELKKARDFHAKFPAPDWSVERRNAIRLKRYRGQIPPPAEREFEAGFDLWEKGRAAGR